MKKFLLTLCMALPTLFVLGQSPGGVSANLRVWLKADSGFTPSSWQDNSGNANNFTQTNASRQPFVATTLYNFNPVIDFGGATSADGRFMVYPSGGPFSANGLSASYFTLTLTRTGGTNGYRDIWGFNGTTTTAALTQADIPAVTKLNDNIVLYNTTTSAFPNQYPDNQLLLSDISYTVGVAGIKYGLNGLTANTTQTRSAAASLQANGSILGSQPEVMNGVMGDMIAYERDLTPAEKIRVRTYIALKYGVTLPHDYISASSQVIWNSSVNAAYSNNIAGIVRDNLSALHQKQSKSVNTGQKLIIGNGSILSETNALNANALTDGQSLIWGDNGLRQSLTTPLVNTLAPGGETNIRFESIWKVQNTGAVGQVIVAWPKGVSNLHLVQSSNEIFDNTDTFTSMAAEVTINGVVYNTATVNLNDGQYFTFAGYAHAPGGVIGQSVWLRADKDVTATAGKVDAWVNQGLSGGNAIPAYPATGKPDFVSSAHNFNPVVTDNTTAHDGLVLADVFPNTQQRALSSFVVQSQPDVSQQITMISYGNNVVPSSSTDDPWFANQSATSLNVFWQSRDGNGIQTYPNSLTRYNNIQTVNSYFIPKYVGASNTSLVNMVGMNGSRTNFNRTSNANIVMGNHLFIHQDGGNNNTSGGSISEVISYDKELTADEQQRIDSYLAVKYGITFYNTSGNSVQNYLSSISTIVWDATVNSTYNNNIFGIANDELSALHQKQSKSVNANQKLIIGAGNSLSDSNAANTNSLTEDQFLIVGDNGLKQGLSTPLAYTGTNGEVNYRFESIWKVQKTSGIGTVILAWPKGIQNFYLVQSNDELFTGGDTFTPMTTEVTVNGVVYNTATVTLGNGEFFTFAGFGNAPGGVTNNLSYWYRADKNTANTGVGTDVTGWTDVWNGTTVAQFGTNALPKYAVGAANYFNFNPGINFTAITQSLANNVVQSITNTSNDIFTVTKEGMTAPGSFVPHFFSITENNATTGASAYDYVGMNPTNGQIERRVAGGGTQFPDAGVNYSTTVPSIMYNTFTNTTLARALNGAANSTPATGYSAVGLALGGHVFGNTRTTTNGVDNLGGLVGNIGETIIYGAGNITAAERRRVDSYLAIKYGITLGRVNTDHYLDTDGNQIWNGAANATYNNNIFGVSRDDIEAFEQKVSKSVNPGTILTVATINDFVNPNQDAARTGFATNKTYFLLGDNNNVTTTPVDVTVGTNTYKRIPRIWMTQEKNVDAGSLFFEADLTAYNSGTFVTTSGKVIMLIADDAAFTTNVIKVNPTSNALAKWVFNQNVADGKFITFAVDPCYGNDTDGDGVPDMCDQDNDNDGIINTNEGYICDKASIPVSVLTTDHVMNYNFTDYNGITGFNFKLTSSAVAQRWASPAAQFNMSGIDPRVNNNIVTYEFDLPVDNLKFWVADLDALEKVNVNLYDQNGTRITDLLPYTTVKAEVVAGSTTFTTDATYGVKISTTRNSGANGNLNYVEISIPGIQISKVEATFVGTNGNTPEYHIGNMCAKRDLDGDRIPDYLDLDSDGDGCPDTIEGAGGFTTANLVNSSMPGGNAGATYNGLSASPVSQNLGNTVDANGIPLVANGGQGVGYSQNSSMNACIDTDNDGKPDIIDLDDDNDGILDTAECPAVYTVRPVTTSSITTTGTVTSGSIQRIADGEGAGGTGNGLNTWYTNVNNLPLQVNMNMQAVSVIDHIKLYGPWGATEWIKDFKVELYDNNNVLLGTENLTAPNQYTGTPILGFSREYTTVSRIRFTILSGQGYSTVNPPRASLSEIVFMDLQICDTDGDGIENRFDLDSDGDGCPDAKEGAGGFTTANLVNSSMPGGNTGAGYTGTAGPVVQNLGNTVGTTTTTMGIPTIAGTGQGIGSSQNATITNCIQFCYKPGIAATAGNPALPTKAGITSLNRAGAQDADNWPMVRNGGWLALESKTKGFVPNRVAFSGGNPVGIPAADFREGMMVYDTTNKCLKIFTSVNNGSTFEWHCVTTQTCPD